MAFVLQQGMPSGFDLGPAKEFNKAREKPSFRSNG